MSNIFNQPFNTPHNTIPFDKISINDYKETFLDSIKVHQQEIDDIANNPNIPNFENTIVEYERSGAYLSRVQYAFYNILSAESTPEMQDFANEISPIETDHFNNITLNEKLFDRVKYVYEHKDEYNLTAEQTTLLDQTYDSFKKNGATLPKEKQTKFRELSAKISSLCLKYGQNLLNATNAFKLYIEDKKELTGIPESILEAALQKGNSLGKSNTFVFDLSYPSYVPFMKYCQNRELRKKLYLAYNTKAYKDQFSNESILTDLVNARLELAQLFGHKCYADYVLDKRMAENKENVNKLLDDLLNAYIDKAHDEVKEIEETAHETDGNLKLMPWDWSYYSNILRNKKYKINDEVVKPYLSLENVKKGVFGLAEKLYGITFKANNNIPVYNKEVETFEVYDKDGKYLAVLYLDFHPRDGKQGGAWMTDYQCQHIDENNNNIRPHVSLVMNFTRPTESEPALLSIDELSTFLHEFGHSLHSIFSNVNYESLSGTNVYRDFVELPSQLMENWATEKEFLDGFAKHFKTGEYIPNEIINKIKEEANFNVAYGTLRQLSFGYLDMAWHTIENKFCGDVKDFESKAWSKTQLLPEINETLMSSQFSHIFDGGYAAGYYSYKWAEVLDADAFSVYKEKGIFDKETAERFRKCILEKGGSEHPMKLYIDFRNQKPSINSLLKRTGIIK